VASKKEYLERLQLTIEHMHECRAKHVDTESVHETFQGQTVWDGEVEVFEITGRPPASRCYAWSFQDDSGEHIASVLGLPPVKTALDAVRVYIAGEVRRGRK
jgi:hypothetical protein